MAAPMSMDADTAAHCTNAGDRDTASATASASASDAANSKTASASAESSTTSTNTDLFRIKFKRYKKRRPPPDLSDVIDFHAYGYDQQHQDQLDQTSRVHPDVPCQTCAATSCKTLGLTPVDEWECFKLECAPGFIYIKDPFCPGYQRYWIQRCLQDYPRKPNVSNLDGQPSASAALPISVESLDTLGLSPDKKCPADQLRWVTLGYHYDWTSKLYHRHNVSAYPADLAHLSAFVAAVFGWPSFSAQAGIVNYYHLGSALGGHTDHSEFDQTAPIMSFSLGQSAVFLLGGRTKETTPLAMYLHSGDIIIMGGQSRLAYHAVPKVLPSADTKTSPAYLEKVESLAPGFEGETAREQTQHCTTRCSPVESGLAAEPSCQGRGRPTSRGCTRGETDSAVNARPIEADAEGSSRRGDGESQDSQCILKPISERVLTDPDCARIEEVARRLQNDRAWEPLAKYMSRSRVNISVRQVTGHGFDFPLDAVVTGDDATSSTANSSCPSQCGNDLPNSEAKRKVECLK